MIRKFGNFCLALTAVIASGAGFCAAGFDGFLLYGSYGAQLTVLVDGNNDTIMKWDHKQLPDLNGYSCYLLSNGNLLRSSQTVKGPTMLGNGVAPKNGILSEIDETGKKVWAYELADKINCLHHDCKILPNGNLIAVSFVTTTKDQALQKGLDSSMFISITKSFWGDEYDTTELADVQTEKIIEIKPDTTGGNNHQIVWEWNILDHVVPKEQAADHPEKFSGGLGPIWSGQWVHLNGIDYNPGKDLIVFSSRIFSEVYIIDHSTTTAEAATGTGGKYNKGGDLLYRWGRTKNYCIAGDSITTLHCPTWIPEGYTNAGDIMFFHNNCFHNGQTFIPLGGSQVVEITPPVDATGNFPFTAGSGFGPQAPTWKYCPTGVDSMFSMSMSSAIRMRNGNTIVHEAYTGALGTSFGGAPSGGSRIREVTSTGEVVGKPIMCNGNPAKIMYYEKDYPGILALFKKIGVANKSREYVPAKLGRSGINHNVPAHVLTFTNVEGAEISLYSLQGKLIASVTPSTASFNFSTATLSTGAYLIKIRKMGGMVTTQHFSIL